MIRINLLPVKAARKKEIVKGQLAILGVALLIALLACGGLYAMVSSKVSDEKELISKKEAEIASLKKKIGEVAEFKKRQQELREKLEILDKLSDGKTGPVRLLDELSLSIPEKMWIISYSESNGSIVMSGISLTEETVAQFMRKLESSDYYQNVELRVVEQTRNKENVLHKFEISCRAQMPAKQSPAK
ncbi:PilN domain-containing protein [Desulfuromonas sp. AOP6]|uniref:PilN domain-containing protein n=1 Tax=Desulfuromonas sp. AOP6 TaxID=1566351 RepID=UPI00126ECD6B|nr:PilN domain-containing protein [Desulfuromonas sp. AOP6]BCA80200.1 fimbrial protein [Desulfuromonas sp. AOP6]